MIRNVIREGRSMLYTVHGRTKLEVLGGISHPLATFRLLWPRDFICDQLFFFLFFNINFRDIR